MTGQVIIREPPIPVEVDAYIDGVVSEVMPSEGVVVESEGAFLQGIFGVGGETIGPLRWRSRSLPRNSPRPTSSPSTKGRSSSVGR